MFGTGVTAEGVLTSPNYPGKYPNNVEDTETIRGGPGTVLELQFTAFNIKFHSTCRFDHLKIRDEDGTTLMEKTCGSSLPGRITSNSNVVYVDFKTNSNGRETGWRVIWRDLMPTTQ